MVVDFSKFPNFTIFLKTNKAVETQPPCLLFYNHFLYLKSQIVKAEQRIINPMAKR